MTFTRKLMHPNTKHTFYILIHTLSSKKNTLADSHRLQILVAVPVACNHPPQFYANGTHAGGM